MIDTTSRRDRRGVRARHRLDRLISQARADRPADTSALPVDQPWLDVSLDAPPRGAADPGWWPDAGPLPSDTPAEPPDLEPDPLPPRDSGRVLLGAPPPAAEPWWRGRLNRLRERWLPAPADARPRWRLAAVAAAGAVLLGVAVAVGLVMSGSNDAPEVPPALPAASAGESRASGATSSAPGGGSIVISVVGRVAKPGLVTLPDGARVADALEATGGTAPGVNVRGLNLARRLGDGEQIYVGVPTPPNAEPAGGVSAPGEPGGGLVDLNSASLASLDTLPGVGPVTAQGILDWRTRHGRFASVDQLQEVDGIGPTRFARLKDLVVAR
ncbi:helix-hairpin-helix domain-containing protein [Actinophytocola sp.]|uniref:helix-hairpin-helix domain-containing protein n=1 Tax=Actinophytocola sp. TaxID=1872138 RepID=UPI003D6A3C9B